MSVCMETPESHRKVTSTILHIVGDCQHAQLGKHQLTKPDVYFTFNVYFTVSSTRAWLSKTGFLRNSTTRKIMSGISSG